MTTIDSTLGVTKNPAMLEALETIRRLAASDISVLIVGEHGTGKEWAAHTIHRLSSRANGPFWPLDCATMAEDDIEREIFGIEEITRNGINVKRGALENASGGTLLMNEIASLPTATQIKIGRALEYGMIHRLDGIEEVDINVRFISTLSDDYDLLIRNGTLQKEMFYRISTVTVELPPLRERREDIPLLIDKFLLEMRGRDHITAVTMSPEAQELCLAHDWPGNVRQLKSIIEYSCVMCTEDTIRPMDLPAYLQTAKMENKPSTRNKRANGNGRRK
jgi:DNA-binding NtrC family response regulator